MKKKRNVLAERFKELLKKEDVTVRGAIDTLSGKGQAMLLILLSLPFCQPIQVPGFSIPFGIVLAFIGLRIAFGHRVWFPKMLLDKKIPHQTLEKIAGVAIKVTDKLKFFVSTRWVWLVQSPTLHVAHGLTIAALGIWLAMPLPIPFTNLLAAWSILAFGLGLLEDDGVMVVVGYLLAVLSWLFVIGIFLFGKKWLLSVV